MSHLYSVEQATAMVPAYLPLGRDSALADPTSSRSFDPAALRFRQLQAPGQIARVLHLRTEIRLPEATLTDAGFAAREKKEMRWDLWVLSSSPDA